MKRSGEGITTKILLNTLLAVVLLAAWFVSVMIYFMNALTDTVMLNILQPMAKMAAQSVEGNLHVLSDRFLLVKDNAIFTSGTASTQDRVAAIRRIRSGIEFVWLGL